MSEHFKKVMLPLHVLSCLVIPFFTTEYIVHFLLGWVAISGFGIAVGMHRYFCHNSFKTYKPVHYILGWLACLGSQGSPIFWNAGHVHHHTESDNDEDIHSPKHGYWNAYWGWIITLDPRKVPMRYSRRLIADPYQKWLHLNYYKVVWGSVLLFSILNILVSGDLYATLYGMILPMMWSTHQEPITNIFGHGFGYRNFDDVKDNSTNSRLLGLLTFGQCLHNNHHAKPNAYYYGTNYTEVDPGGALAWLIKK